MWKRLKRRTNAHDSMNIRIKDRSMVGHHSCLEDCVTMISCRNRKDDYDVYDCDDAHDGDDDAGDDADLNRRLVLVRISPIPSTAYGAPLKSCVMG